MKLVIDHETEGLAGRKHHAFYPVEAESKESLLNLFCTTKSEMLTVDDYDTDYILNEVFYFLGIAFWTCEPDIKVLTLEEWFNTYNIKRALSND